MKKMAMINVSRPAAGKDQRRPSSPKTIGRMRETPKRISRVMETAVEAKENKEDVLSRMTALRNSLGTVILHKFTGLKLGKKQKMRKPIDSVRFPHYNENRKKQLGFREAFPPFARTPGEGCFRPAGGAIRDTIPYIFYPTPKEDLMDGPDTKVICVAAMDLFRQEGLRFTMQQLAQRLHISKKTLYTRYASKEELLLDMIDDAFGAIHARKRAILAENLPLEEKLRRVIIALPEEYAATNLCRLEELEEKFPAAAERVRLHLETGWEPTLALLEETRQAGLLRDVPFDILRTMITGSIEAFLRDESLTAQEYANALETMIDIFLEGVLER